MIRQTQAQIFRDKQREKERGMRYLVKGQLYDVVQLRGAGKSFDALAGLLREVGLLFHGTCFRQWNQGLVWRYHDQLISKNFYTYQWVALWWVSIYDEREPLPVTPEYVLRLVVDGLKDPNIPERYLTWATLTAGNPLIADVLRYTEKGCDADVNFYEKTRLAQVEKRAWGRVF